MHVFTLFYWTCCIIVIIVNTEDLLIRLHLILWILSKQLTQALQNIRIHTQRAILINLYCKLTSADYKVWNLWSNEKSFVWVFSSTCVCGIYIFVWEIYQWTWVFIRILNGNESFVDKTQFYQRIRWSLLFYFKESKHDVFFSICWLLQFLQFLQFLHSLCSFPV